MNWPIEDVEAQAAVIAEKMAADGIAVDEALLQSVRMMLQLGNDGFYTGYARGYDDGKALGSRH